MNGPVRRRDLFLRTGQFRQLCSGLTAEQRQRTVLGGLARQPSRRKDTDAAADHGNPWGPANRTDVAKRACAGGTLRVALVCDAGLGKTTNMTWLESCVARQQDSPQIPLLLRLDSGSDLKVLLREAAGEDAILHELALRLRMASDGDANAYRHELAPRRAAGRITLLIDGLDHAMTRGDEAATMLANLLRAHAWQRCPVWVSGRPSAFRDLWGLFAADHWQFLKLEPLDESEVRLYLRERGGGDWSGAIAPEARWLLAVPRFLHLLAGVFERRLGDRRPTDAAGVIGALDLRTPADLYDLAYLEPGEYPRAVIPGYDDLTRERGLLAAGLFGVGERIGLLPHETPGPLNYQRRIDRTAALLGAVAFEMLAHVNSAGDPTPILDEVPIGALPEFLDRVERRLLRCGQRPELNFANDLNLLTCMNNGTLDFLLFRELNPTAIAWYDPTVLAFFAAYWAMKHGTTEERDTIQHWRVRGNERITAFDEFWQFAAELPDRCVRDQQWLDVFGPCYAPPAELRREAAWVQWHRRMLYYSFPRVQRRSPVILERWRALPRALRAGRGTKKQLDAFREIFNGFRMCPPVVTADNLKFMMGSPANEEERFPDERYREERVEPFALHEFPVTNAQYTLFDPTHAKTLETSFRKPGQPVIEVTWYDAWCFACWLECRLPTEIEWEYACRATKGRETRYNFGDAIGPSRCNYGGSVGHPTVKGDYPPNDWGLFDLHGNVWEWCDSLDEPGASARVLRGGSWSYFGRDCRSARRVRFGPEVRYHDFGFRLAAVPASLEPSLVSKFTQVEGQ